MRLQKLMIVCLLFGMLAACDEDAGQGDFAVVGQGSLVVTPELLSLAAPTGDAFHVDASLTIQNVGDGELVIESIEVVEDDGTVEMAALDADDWSDRTLEAATDGVLALRWTVLDAGADKGRIIVRSSVGTVEVPWTTVDIDPAIELTTEPEGTETPTGVSVGLVGVASGSAGSVVATIRSTSIAPLSIETICIIDGNGQCKQPAEDALFRVCHGSRAALEGCEAPSVSDGLPQNATYTFTAFYLPPAGTVDTHVGRILVHTNAAAQPDIILTIEGSPCVRENDGDVCGTCGDGRVDEGEECDDGNVALDDRCDLSCGHINRCGDGTHNPDTEACDDGNDIDTDDCLSDCTLPECGDGFVWEGNEPCDDGNDIDTDDCISCALPECGDGHVWEGNEPCDDGNDVDTDGCITGCILPECGDGFVWEGNEPCDDGNDIDTDDCVSCVLPECGDGHVWENNESCDDGNDSNTDSCVEACVFANCGDGFVQEDVEECDDDNNNPNDGCSPTCEEETLVDPGWFDINTTANGHSNMVRQGDQHIVIAYTENADRTVTPTSVNFRVLERSGDGFSISEPQSVAQSICAPTQDQGIKLMGAMGPNHFIVVLQHPDWSDEIQLWRRDGNVVSRLQSFGLGSKDWYAGHPIDDTRYLFRWREGNSGEPVTYQMINRSGDSFSLDNTFQRPAPNSFPGLSMSEPQTPSPLVRIGPNQFRELRGGYVRDPGYLGSWVLTVNDDTMSASQVQVHNNTETRTMEPLVVGNGSGEALVFYSSYQNNWHYGHFTSGSSPFVSGGSLHDGAQTHAGQSRDSTDGYVDGIYYQRSRSGTLYRFEGVAGAPEIVDTELPWRLSGDSPSLLELANHAVMLVGDFDISLRLRVVPIE